MRTVAGLGVVLLILTGCGNDTPGEAPAAGTTTTVTAPATSASATTPDVEPYSEYDDCVALTQPLIDKLDEIDSRREVALNVEEYGDLVSDAVVVFDAMYEQVASGGVDSRTCVTAVAAPLEKAVNLYRRAHASWEACIDLEDVDGFECVIDEVLFVQQLWERAARAVSNAVTGLRALPR